MNSGLLLEMQLDLLAMLFKCKQANLISYTDAVRIHNKYACLSQSLLEPNLWSACLWPVASAALCFENLPPC